MKLTSASEYLMYTTLRLKSKKQTATGIIYEISNHKFVVISNRHFAENKELNELDYNKTSINDYLEFMIHLDDGTNYKIKDIVKWYLHPTTDLAIFDLSELLEKNKSKILPRRFLHYALNRTLIPTEDQLENLVAIENVCMYGYPDGRYDKKNNFPLIRSGVTASHPAIDYNGEKKALIDIPCISGSSGSPVMILNESMHFEKNIGNTPKRRMLFLGIEHASPIRYLNNIVQIKPDPNDANKFLETNFKDLYLKIDMSLGIYIKSSEIYSFNDIFKILIDKKN